VRLSEMLPWRPPTEYEWLRMSSWAWKNPAKLEVPESEDRMKNVIVNGILRPVGQREYSWRLLGVRVKGAAA
jgi:hypothetical protein